jgi:hypothetical protein
MIDNTMTLAVWTIYTAASNDIYVQPFSYVRPALSHYCGEYRIKEIFSVELSYLDAIGRSAYVFLSGLSDCVIFRSHISASKKGIFNALKLNGKTFLYRINGENLTQNNNKRKKE